MLKQALVILAFGFVAGVAAAQEPPAAPTPAEEESMVDSPFFKLGWPKIEMPKFSWKPGFGGAAEQPAAAQQPGGNPVSRTLDKVADSSRRASAKVRDMWGSAVSRVSSFGKSDGSQQVAQKDSQPGFWSRLLTPEEPKRAETVQEFLAQERVGTTR